MKIASSFTVPAAADKVLTLFLDPATMQACVPGCEELTQSDETHYQGVLVNEVAHVKFRARFNAEITSTTASADTSEPAVVRAVVRGEDRRLGSTMKVTATLTITPLSSGAEADRCEVAYEFELAILGKLGRLGEAVIRRRATEVEKQFAEALTAVSTGQPVPVPESRKPAMVRALTGHSTPDAAQQGETLSALTTAGATAPRVVETRSRDQWLVLVLAVAAAFAYGVIFGGRRSVRP
ncbi:CoxG family protein [Nocardia bovistercoris]|uniref:SRPBCC family protein n=1 Tax=Nocardia bovistercoris TaxID=2785916 RepID=A0A931I9U8_9NOCA|nr:SRPBCC domain-containing protein [Nocardia bovistercoris]MBH0776342.1 SRPBCC family protein [Nocardia bovistercoris]